MSVCDPTTLSHRRPPYGKVSFGIIIGCSLTILVAVFYLVSWPDHLELKLLNLRHKQFPLVTNHPDVVVLVIDDNSLEQLGRWPWHRQKLAQMIRICKQAGAKQIALDINMPEEENVYLDHPGITDISRYEPPPRIIGNATAHKVDNDLIFKQAIKQCGNITLPFYVDLYDPQWKHQPETFKNTYADQVRPLIENNPDITFEQVFHTIWPDKDIETRDTNYQLTLQAYIRSLAIHDISRFSFDRDPSKIASPILFMKNLTPPIPDFANAIENIGFVSVLKDKDGEVRRIPLLGRYGDRYYKQFAFSIFCQLNNINDDHIDLSQPEHILLSDIDLDIPLDKDGDLILAWADTWQDDHCISITQVAHVWDLQKAHDANLAQIRMIDDLTFYLSGVPDDLSSVDQQTRTQIEQMRQQLASLENKDKLLQANKEIETRIADAQQKLHTKLNDKIVLIGSTAPGVPDFFVTPMGITTPGVMVHRNILNTLMNRTFLYRPSRAIELAIILILGFAMTAVSAALRPLASGLVLAALIGLAYIINFRIAFAHFHYWFAVATPMAAVFASFSAVTFYRQITEGLARRQITTRFKQYTSPAVVDQIVRSGSTVSFAGEKRHLTCFFSDLAGFTSVSERLGSQKTVAVLNIYLDRMTEVLDRYDATVNKFLGDGIFAFFNAPIEMPSHCRLACLSALDSQIELAKLVHDQQQIDPAFPTLSMRVGIGTGEVIVGDCGSHRRFDYTAIGDTVNLTSRLEGANKAFGTRIMVCENVYQSVKEELAARYLGKVRVVGKDIPVGIYELIARSENLTNQQKSYSQMFQSAVELYQSARINDALDAFELCIKTRPDDKAAAFYLKTTQPLAGRPIPQSFDGAVELTTK